MKSGNRQKCTVLNPTDDNLEDEVRTETLLFGRVFLILLLRFLTLSFVDNKGGNDEI